MIYQFEVLGKVGFEQSSSKPNGAMGLK